MYKKMEKLLIILSIILVSSFSIFIVISLHKQMFAGTDGGVLVLKAKSNIKESINDIAEKNNVLIAKQIMVPSIDGKTDNQPTFQKFGKGTLPADFPEQSNQAFIENSNDAVYYFIFGKTLDANSLSNYLNKLGNTTVVSDTDWRFQGIISIFDVRLVIGTLLFIISYISLLIANVIRDLKKQGIQRLSGLSTFILAFSGMKKRLLCIIMTTAVSLLTGTLILYSLNLKRIMYFYVILFPTLFWALILVMVEVLVGVLVYLFLQRQEISLVIKERAPITALMNVVFSLQLLSLLCLIFSFSNIQSSFIELNLLNKGKNYWADQEYYSPSLLTGDVTQYGENLSEFLVAANEKEELLLVADNFNKVPIENQYFPTSEGNENVLYVTPNYIEKVGIELDSTLNNDMTILIPESQKSKENELTSAWSKILNSSSKETAKLNISSESYKMPTKELFTFRIFGWAAVSNQSFVTEPLIIVIAPHIFNDQRFDSGILFSWISREQFLFSNNKTTASLIKKYGLENILGSFSNGKFSVSNRLAEKKVQQLFMIVASCMALISATFLFYLMNQIYLYQNRKKFAVFRISGESLINTHKNYLAKLLFILIFSIILIFICRLDSLTFVVPLIFSGLQLLLFEKQVRNNKSVSISILKGE